MFEEASVVTLVFRKYLNCPFRRSCPAESGLVAELPVAPIPSWWGFRLPHGQQAPPSWPYHLSLLAQAHSRSLLKLVLASGTQNHLVQTQAEGTR